MGGCCRFLWGHPSWASFCSCSGFRVRIGGLHENRQARGGGRPVARARTHGLDRILGIHDRRPTLGDTCTRCADVPSLRSGARIAISRVLKMQSWYFHNGSAMRYDCMDKEAPLVRLVYVWPGVGEQHFDVQLYANGYTDEASAKERRSSLAEAVALAEDWTAR